MIVELGHLALIFALCVAGVQTVTGLIGGWRRDNAMMAIASTGAHIQAICTFLAFCALTYAYVESDFSVLNVYQNSHSQKPMMYKFAGVWGNHEGSLLLWIAVIAGLGSAVAGFGARLPATLRSRVLGIQGLIGLLFLAFALFTSNPFERLDPIPFDGTDLNPLLQDPGLVFHPPFLYLGYVGFSVAFSFAVAALLEGRVDPAWAKWVRPWTLLAWTSLTLGIAMGSWWAYYELGWGGYWFWDPVENASLMPWLAGTALLHSAIVVEKRDTLKLWTVLMAILAFSTSLLGAFVVRSGTLTSVHAFANDPDRGVLLLAIWGALTGAALILFAVRGGAMKSGGSFSSISRESALIANNVLLCVLTFVVMLGTFWPMFVEVVSGERMTVGPPYYTVVTTPLMVLLVLAMGAGVLLPWKRGDIAAAMTRLRIAGGATVLAMLVALYLSGFRNVLAAVGLGIGLWVILFSFTDAAFRTKLFSVGPAAAWRRARGFPRAYWGGTLAHLGVGVCVLGMVGTSLWLTEEQRVMAPGESVEIAGLTVRYESIEELRIANYNTEMSTFTVLKDGNVVGILQPERRHYPAANQDTVEADVVPRWANDLYIAVGEARGEGRLVRLYHHPLVYFLWIGSLMMVFGGMLSLSDRRFRIGAPQRAAAKQVPSAPQQPTPPGPRPEEVPAE